MDEDGSDLLCCGRKRKSSESRSWLGRVGLDAGLFINVSRWFWKFPDVEVHHE
jgi:hypothetical protein